jgi:hypothetical protein
MAPGPRSRIIFKRRIWVLCKRGGRPGISFGWRAFRPFLRKARYQRTTELRDEATADATERNVFPCRKRATARRLRFSSCAPVPWGLMPNTTTQLGFVSILYANLNKTHKMVGATGVEPARIAPQDPKSCVSANSTTRPRRRKALLETEYSARAEAPNSKLQAPEKVQAPDFKHPRHALGA